MLHVARHSTTRRNAFVTRRRFQLGGALLVAVALPYIVRAILTWVDIGLPSTHNAFLGNLVAVCLAYWMRLSLEPYPGIRSSYVILPATAAAYAAVLISFLLTRLDYDRMQLALGFIGCTVWFYGTYFLVQRASSMRIGVVPFGAVDRLAEIDKVEWVPLHSPTLNASIGCDSIVADFAADLPDEWERFLADAALAGRIVYQVKQLSESLTGRVTIGHLSENSFGSLLPAKGYFQLKSMLDRLVALAVLPFALPAMAAVAVAVLAEGGGPVLFRQQRVGHAGKLIEVLKFRTMHTAIPDSGGFADPREAARRSAMTSDSDPRVTRVGAWLRRMRIDELPQIWNILKGEMSWIGPRPEAEVLSSWYAAELPFYRYRHVVKPGISGWAQVNQGHVADVAEVNRKLEYDFYYIKNFSAWLDLLILFKTIKTMLTGFGAR